MAVTTDREPRRRRQPQEARAEILNAATELLRTRPAHEATVAAIMERTTLSRKSFYVYFRDRSELLTTLIQPLRAEADAGLAHWRNSDDPVAGGRAALLAAARTYRRHGAVLRAIFRSETDDPEVRSVRDSLVAAVVDVATEKIAEVGAPLPDPRGSALALATMNIHMLLDLRPDADDTELAALVDVLATIWERTLGVRR
ncbi:helix-turn-helix domain-containing protein [Nocardia sp. NPDC005825]|uniref:TetR/AcrR family transcriptional regulator n=1 Tax=unclassified Nocardia TaxID=2637762 RepID=UPI0033DCBD0A